MPGEVRFPPAAYSTLAMNAPLVRRINVESRYSDVAVHKGVAYLAGQVPDDDQAGIEIQTRQVLATIDRLLAQAGSGRQHLLMVTVYLADMADYAAMNGVYDQWVAGIQAPPRATVAARLAKPGWRIEVVVTAAVVGSPLGAGV